MTQKQDLRERCSYLLILFKAKDKALFEKYTLELSKISAEASTEFYHYLLAEYKKLVEGPSFSQAQMPAPAPKPVVQKPAAAAPKKKVAKKVAKKVTKKAVPKTAKKTAKKSAKKSKKR
jgi:hypothetical protein